MRKLSLDELIKINKAVCEKSGEPFNILNKDALLSALSVQYNDYYENEDLMLSALVRSLSLCHGFEQGNKRTAFLAIALLKLPKCQPKELANAILEIAKGNLKDIEYICEILYKQGEK